MNRCHQLLLSVVAVCSLAVPMLGQAQISSGKTVSLVVPYPAGGLSDSIARQLNVPLGKVMNQTVIVENIGGAGGAIAVQKVLNAAADGHLLFQGSPNELILAPLINPAVKFKSDDLKLVQMVGISPLAFLARKDLPASSVDEFIDYARKRAMEGRPITYASVGNGSLYHLLGAHLSKVTGIEMIHVPYKGGAPAVQDLMGGQVDIYLAPFGKQYEQSHEQGRLKVLAVLSGSKTLGAEKFPLITESKQLKDFTFNTWSGYFVKKDTPEATMLALNKALGQVLTEPTVLASLETNNLIVLKPQSLAELSKYYVDVTRRYRDIASQLNLN